MKVRYKLVFFSFLIIVVFLISWMSFAPSNIEASRSATMPLIMALEQYKDKAGSYPKNLLELEKALPDFDLTPYREYDQCIRRPGYCNKSGHAYVSYGPSWETLCSLALGKDTDFTCVPTL